MEKHSSGKSVKESMVEMTELVMPQDTNPIGNIFGGRVMQLIDIAGGVAAMRHARRNVVTVSVDKLDFKHPIKMGQIMTLRAYIIYTGRTSMEVQVDVFSEEPITGDKVHTTTAHLTYVALNQAGQPVPVPPVIPENKEEIKRYDAARTRRQNRKTGD